MSQIAAHASSVAVRTGRPRHAVHRYLLQHPGLLETLTRWRHFYYTKIRRRGVRHHDGVEQRSSTDPLKRTMDYNLSLITSFANRRSFRMIKLVSCVSGVKRNGQVLFVGPRTEADLLSLYAFGFAWNSIRGLDLFSYSPKIDVGDMHQMPYPDDSFDISFSSWALTYSHDPVQACRELVRVTRPGGLICVGCEYDHEARLQREAGDSGILLNCWFESLEHLKACFGPAVGPVLWQEQAPNIWMPGTKELLTLVFHVSKESAADSASRPPSAEFIEAKSRLMASEVGAVC